MAGGVYQNTVFGLAAKLPPRYTGAVVLGSVSKKNQGAFLVSRQGQELGLIILYHSSGAWCYE